MGYCNAMPTFQRVGNYTLGDSLWREAVLMVDDGVVGSATREQHRRDLTVVLTKFAERHHAIKPSKMSILPVEVKYLGHKVTEKGIAPNDDHVKAVRDMPPPVGADGLADITMVRSACGIFKYLRRYIAGCGKLCGALNEHLTQDATRVWEPRHQEAFEALKEAVVKSTGVWSIDYNYPIYVCTDGSKEGVGGYIYQKIDNQELSLIHI